MRLLLPNWLPGTLLLCTGVAACAATPADAPVSTIPVSSINEAADVLPASGYVSTGQPDAETLRAIADAGYVGVIDLRTAGEPRGFDEAATAEALGLRYVSLPIGDTDDLTFENAAALDRALADMPGPVLLHCASGNRVGALFALRAKAAGASDEEALAIGKAAGLTRYEGAVKKKLAEAN